ncbi:MAG: DUF302 domain-containing protein [Pseudomonadota bacterium]
MRNWSRFAVLAILALFITIGGASAMAQGMFLPQGMIIKESKYPAKETMDRFHSIVHEKGLTVFARVDHAAGAEKVGKSLPPTEVLIFGNPAAGTPMMAAAATMGIDLPLKALVFERDGLAYLAYYDIEFLASRHQAEGVEPVMAKVAATLDALSDQAVK